MCNGFELEIGRKMVDERIKAVRLEAKPNSISIMYSNGK